MDQHASARHSALPASPHELELLVQRTLGGIADSPNQERAVVYSRVSSIEPRAHSFSMDYQPDRSEEYARSKGWHVAAVYADLDRTGRNASGKGDASAILVRALLSLLAACSKSGQPARLLGLVQDNSILVKLA